MGDPPLLQAEAVTKRFGGIVALDQMHFTAAAGEVHAILGENGAGKSTFIGTLAGALRADEGRILLRGAPYEPRSPVDAATAGIATVLQELSLIPDLTVAENIWFGSEDLTLLRTVDRRRIEARTRALFADLGLPAMDPGAPLRSLTIGQRQFVEIAKALAGDAEILILDEATSALLPDQVDWLIRTARARAEAGKLVIYISHRLAEVRRVADRVTVLRNGQTVGTEAIGDLTDERIVSMMLGRRLANLYPERRATAKDQIALSVERLAVQPRLHGVDLELHEGEILGVAGLEGHGQRELFLALFGAVRAQGQVTVRGRPVRIRSPRHAMSAGIGMVLLPEDRRQQGLLLTKTVRENLVLSALARVARFGIIDPRAEAAMVERGIQRTQIKADTPEQLAGTLSGGNQQKVVLAKLLETGARILLFYDPTRGVDVGTKAEMFAMMRELAANGYAILFYSTDLAELAHVADRTLVLSYGTVSTVLTGTETTEDRILAATMAGGGAAHAGPAA
jgi:ribose transport system ATP-binding protein